MGACYYYYQEKILARFPDLPFEEVIPITLGMAAWSVLVALSVSHLS